MKKINLNDIPKHDPFVVPEGYLESLPLRIQEKVQHQPEPAWAGKSSIYTLPRLQLAFSVLVLLVVSVLFLRQPDSQEIDAQLLLNETSQQEVFSYLNNRSTLTVQELAGEAEWDEYELMVSGPGSDEVLEEEITKNIDLYTAEELWK
jgi:hypothetical protein